MKREKVLEFARESELDRQLAMEVPFVIDRLQQFAALIEREVRWDAEPVTVLPDGMKLVEESEKYGSPCPEFWDWLPTAYNFEGRGSFTKYNMEVSFLAGKNSNPTPAVVRQLIDALEAIVGDGVQRVSHQLQEQAKAALAAAKASGL